MTKGRYWILMWAVTMVVMVFADYFKLIHSVWISFFMGSVVGFIITSNLVMDGALKLKKPRSRGD